MKMFVPGKLKEVKEKLDNNQPIEKVTVRTLLRWFFQERRGWYVVQQIREALSHLGLETNPDFNSVFIDTSIEFRKLAPIATPIIAKVQQPENIADKSADDILNIDDPTYRISRLEAASKELISVKPDCSLQEAFTQMVTYDFSQLPVMQSKRDLKGVISWKSVGMKLAVDSDSAIVRDLMEPNYQLISFDTSLFKAIPLIIEHEYVLVKNNVGEISGIITASDLSLQFKQLTEPFLLVAEIENHLRTILSILDIDKLVEGKDERDQERSITNVADLTFGEYIRLFQKIDIWEKINLKLDRVLFCNQLDKIKNIRNNIMHFDPDGLSDQDTDTLRNFVRLLQTLRNLDVF